MIKKISLAFIVATLPLALFAAETKVALSLATSEGVGEKIGEVTISETKYGLVFTPSIKGVPAGVHGFHVHANPSCEPLKAADGKVTPAGAAGGHFDPKATNAHKGPYSDDGHLGDLPALYADANGDITTPVLAPRLTSLDQIKEHALMLHAGGDNHSDHPAMLGGGGARVACGVIK
ncbi:superoxide dismutase family protein [Sulfurospirillum arsenophilum]|uniref:superoxide dismutase family protein n=1 Tax=Sulfurospirillum arsenophilum TaxID=56698 RepID=UPI0005A735C1|nr:superoxide dismutase family protein [Sulfurospirillum arsenophilum]